MYTRSPPVVPVTLLADRWRSRLFPYLVHDLHHLGCRVIQRSVLDNGQSLWSLTLLPGTHPLIFLFDHDIWGVCTGKLQLAGFAQADSQHGGPWTSPSVHSTGGKTARECINVSTKHNHPRK